MVVGEGTFAVLETMIARDGRVDESANSCFLGVLIKHSFSNFLRESTVEGMDKRIVRPGCEVGGDVAKFGCVLGHRAFALV